MLCDNLEGWDEVGGGRRLQQKGTYVYLWLIHIDVWQKPMQYCKVIILQVKINKILKIKYRMKNYRAILLRNINTKILNKALVHGINMQKE